MSKYDYVGMPLSPEREEKLRKKREKLAKMSQRICQKFGNVLTANEVRALSGVLIKHPNARICLLKERNFHSAISLLKADNFDGAVFAVGKLAAQQNS